MLTLFIIQSGITYADPEKTIESLKELHGDHFVVRTVTQINETQKKDGWYLVLYDNEVVHEELQASFEVFMASKLFNMYTIMKKEKDVTLTQTTRLFRTDIKLQENSLMPVKETEIHLTRIMNGWIRNQDEICIF